MKLSYVIAAIEELAPKAIQESWDNSGLQVGLPEGETECSGVLLCVDVSEEIIAEAVECGCNLVLSHHPLIFKGLKRLAGKTPAERAVAAAIRAGVAVYSAHTSLDSAKRGISHIMAERLGAKVLRVLSSTAMRMECISVICARKDADDVRMILLDTENTEVKAPDVNSFDFSGDALEVDNSAEIPVFAISHNPLTRVEVTVPAMHSRRLCEKVLSTGKAVKISTTALENKAEEYGLGVVAEFPDLVTMGDLPGRLRQAFGTEAIRASRAAQESERPIRCIALCGGAGGEFIPLAISAGASAYVSADIRYHDFADHRDDIAIFDVGHFESENCAKDIFYTALCEKFPNFAVRKSQTENNPVIYF